MSAYEFHLDGEGQYWVIRVNNVYHMGIRKENEGEARRQLLKLLKTERIRAEVRVMMYNNAVTEVEESMDFLGFKRED
jgi:hypothetical protein